MKTSFHFSKLRRVRGLLWSVVLSLTGLILLYPVHLAFGYSPLESLYIFPNLEVFGLVFYSWFTLLILLVLLIEPAPNSHLLHALLACIFSLGFLGSYVVYSSPASVVDFEAGGLAFANFVDKNGFIIQPATASANLAFNFGYFDFPFMAILGSIVSQILNVSVLAVRNVLLLFNSVALSVFLYVAYAKLLCDSRIAVFAVMVSVVGNEIVGGVTRYLPSGEGILFTAFFFLLLSLGNKVMFESTKMKIVTLIFLVATSILHLPTVVVFCCILLGIALMLRMTHREWTHVLKVSLVLMVVVLAWSTFWAITTTSTLFNVNFFDSMRQGFIGFAYILNRTNAYFGPSLPLWATLTREFWIAMLFGIPILLVTKRFFFHRNLQLEQIKIIGAIVGVVFFTGFAILLSSYNGGQQFYRFPTYAGFFAVFILLDAILTSKRYKRYILTLLIISLLSLSFPTFLVDNPHPNISQFYPQDYGASSFLSTAITQQSKSTIFVDPDTNYLLLYYLPYAGIVYAPYPPDQVSLSDFNTTLTSYYSDYLSASNKYVLFVYSPRITVRYEDIFGIPASSPFWTGLQDNLSKSSSQVFNNGFIQIYSH